jgi:hypothetical protein
MAGSCAIKVRLTPLMVIVSAATGVAQHSTAAAATYRNVIGMGSPGKQNRSYKWFRVVSEFCSRNRTAKSELTGVVGRTGGSDMKLAIAFVTAAGLALAIPVAANADDARVGVGVGPVGAGVTVGESHDRDRTTVIKREGEPRDHTTVIKKERDEPADRTTIIKRERD